MGKSREEEYTARLRRAGSEQTAKLYENIIASNQKIKQENPG